MNIAEQSLVVDQSSEQSQILGHEMLIVSQLLEALSNISLLLCERLGSSFLGHDDLGPPSDSLFQLCLKPAQESIKAELLELPAQWYLNRCPTNGLDAEAEGRAHSPRLDEPHHFDLRLQLGLIRAEAIEVQHSVADLLLCSLFNRFAPLAWSVGEESLGVLYDAHF